MPRKVDSMKMERRIHGGVIGLTVWTVICVAGALTATAAVTLTGDTTVTAIPPS